MKILSSGLTDVGMKREGNEDSWAGLDEEGLYIVADGMGGHAAGEIASGTAVTTVTDFIKASLHKETGENGDTTELGIDHYMNLLEKGVLQANETICHLSEENADYSGMGTTLSAMIVQNNQAAVAHVGDSRIYRLRDGVMKPVTTDHSWVNEQMQRNIITSEEAKTHRWRNVITRALGNTLNLEVDTRKLDLLPDDCFVLCSDGLTGMVDDSDLENIVSSMKDDLDGACQSLVDMAKAAGGDDNITVILLRVVE